MDDNLSSDHEGLMTGLTKSDLTEGTYTFDDEYFLEDGDKLRPEEIDDKSKISRTTPSTNSTSFVKSEGNKSDQCFPKKVSQQSKTKKKKRRPFDKQKKDKLDTIIKRLKTRTKSLNDNISQLLSENYNFTEQLFRQSYIRPKYTDAGVGNRGDLNFNTSNASVFYHPDEYSSAFNS